jgi:hypothetical protein
MEFGGMLCRMLLPYEEVKSHTDLSMRQRKVIIRNFIWQMSLCDHPTLRMMPVGCKWMCGIERSCIPFWYSVGATSLEFVSAVSCCEQFDQVNVSSRLRGKRKLFSLQLQGAMFTGVEAVKETPVRRSETPHYCFQATTTTTTTLHSFILGAY